MNSKWFQLKKTLANRLLITYTVVGACIFTNHNLY